LVDCQHWNLQKELYTNSQWNKAKVKEINPNLLLKIIKRTSEFRNSFFDCKESQAQERKIFSDNIKRIPVTFCIAIALIASLCGYIFR